MGMFGISNLFQKNRPLQKKVINEETVYYNKFNESGKDLVLRKFLNGNYYKNMSKEDLEMLADILSNKEKIKQTYLHKDFSVALKLQKKINEMKIVNKEEEIKVLNKEEEKENRKNIFNINSPNENEELSEKKEIQLSEKKKKIEMKKNIEKEKLSVIPKHLLELKENSFENTFLNYEDYKILKLEFENKDEASIFIKSDDNDDMKTDSNFDKVKDKNEDYEKDEESDILKINLNPFKITNDIIKIKFIVSEISQNDFEKNLKKIVSPILSKYDYVPEFGFFHVALAIGVYFFLTKALEVGMEHITVGNSSVFITNLIKVRYVALQLWYVLISGQLQR
jgi:hypothetical protein